MTAIDAGAHTVTLGDGEGLPWDRLLLATGAEPRRLPLPGADLDGVLTLRTLADSERLHDTAVAGGRAGGDRRGLDRLRGRRLGAPARHGGDPDRAARRAARERPRARRSGASTPTSTASTGSSCSTGAGVEAIEGEGRVERVRLAGGRTIDCSAVLIGVGVTPRTALAEAAGLAVDDGILVDATLRSSAPDI